MRGDASGAAAGVLFDLDGVVIDSEELYFQAYRQVLRAWGILTPCSIWRGQGNRRRPDRQRSELQKVRDPVACCRAGLVPARFGESQAAFWAPTRGAPTILIIIILAKFNSSENA